MRFLRNLISWIGVSLRVIYLIPFLLKLLLLFLFFLFKYYRAYKAALNELRKAGVDPQTARELADIASPGLGRFLDWVRSRKSRE